MTDSTAPTASSPSPLPRVTIRFCTQCKWMLRAAYFAQELLSTFSTSLGEVALQPATGGVFVVEIVSASASSAMADGESEPATQQRVLWDRKADGGFPETKELKRRVRDVIEPGRDLGHVDRDHAKEAAGGSSSSASGPGDAPAQAQAQAQAAAGADEQKQGQNQDHHRTGHPRPGDLLKDALEHSQPRPPPLHSQWSGRPGVGGGVRPLVKEPPEVANNIVRQKLAAKERARLEAEGHAGASPEQDAQTGEGQGEGKGEKKEVCEDCS